MLLRALLDIWSLSLFSTEYGRTRNSASKENHPINMMNYKLESPKISSVFPIFE